MKNLQLIDFETRFTKDLLAWCAKHRDIAADEEKMGELTPMFYEKWRSSPKEWLDGKSPDAYFEEIEDMQALLSMMIDYILIGKQPPVSLTERILSEPKKAYPILLGIIHAKESEEMDAEQLNRVKYETVCLIQEMDEEHPIEAYIEDLICAEEGDDYFEEIIEILASQAPHKEIYRAYEAAETDYAKKSLMDILAGFTGEEEAYQILIKHFVTADDDLAFAAACLGKLGDERALYYMESALNEPFLDYFNYTAVKNAMEEIAGKEFPEKEFPGDELYERMMQEEQ